MPSPNYSVLCFPLPYRVAPVFVRVVSPPLVHRSSLRRLICPVQDHFIFLTVLIISMTFVLSLTQMLVFLSLYVMLSILLSILVCAAASLFCACLVSVHVSASYGIAGSTQEFYTCLFRQMARLLLKMSRCLAYGVNNACQYLTFIYLFKCILSYFYLTFQQLIYIFYRNVNVSNFLKIYYNELQRCCWNGDL